MGDVTELREADRWKEPAHPSAQLVARESQAAVDRLIQQLDSLDTKASFLAAGAFVLVAGFIAGIAAKPPTNPHVQDAAIAALLLDLVALLPILYTWWPRTIDMPPHPRGLREHHFNDVEARALQAIADRIVTSFDDTKKVAEKKAAGIKIAMISMLIAASVTVFVFSLDLIKEPPTDHGRAAAHASPCVIVSAAERAGDPASVTSGESSSRHRSSSGELRAEGCRSDEPAGGAAPTESTCRPERSSGEPHAEGCRLGWPGRGEAGGTSRESTHAK